MTVALDISWRSCIKTWINESLEHGHTIDSLVESMTNDGFDKDAALTAIDAVLAGEIPVDTAYEYDPAPVSTDRSIYAHDRMIHALLRIEKPQLILFDNVLSADECDQVIEMSRNRLSPSTIIDPTTGALESTDARASESCVFSVAENPFVERLDQRISALMNCPVENGEGLQIVHYDVSGEFRAHFDYFPPNDAGSAAHYIRGGQRTATLIVYLNDVESGGETAFTRTGHSFAPRKGQAVYFRYFNNLGQLDEMTQHAGLPVHAGEKWIMTKWMHRYPFPG
ncbi:2OG-Fe(II) oxygenase [Nocardia sp. NPDC001965]